MSKLGDFYSWQIKDDIIAMKKVDKSFFEHNGSAIPKEIQWYWGIYEYDQSYPKDIKLFLNNIEYSAYIEKDAHNRARIFWHTDLSKILIEEFQYNGDINNITYKYIDFRKIDSFNYELVFENKNENSAVVITDYDWYKFLLDNAIFDKVNFWNPTPWGFRKLNKGDKVFFLLKQEYGRKICGSGDFVKYEVRNISSAWNEYGLGNGVNNLNDFEQHIKAYTEKNTKAGYQGKNHEIGCLILENICFLLEGEQVSPSFYGWDIPNPVVTFKYVYYNSIYTQTPLTVKAPFVLVDCNQKEYVKNKSKKREGQSQFKKAVMTAYNNKCCITGEDTSSVIQAAHIQEYISRESNHVQNGLPLRVDFHNLFDSGLITIDENYEICVSNYLKSEYYLNFVGRKISLPSPENMPSIESIKWHNKNIFRV